MSRQVDVKALISHIVKGDGLDKCRICMGDTSQGHVHLTDTVMMDGEKAVTLSELLELISGIEVVFEEALPSSLCHTCSVAAFKAAEFQNLVRRTEHEWKTTVKLLDHVPSHKYGKTSSKIHVVLSTNSIDILDEDTRPALKVEETRIVKRPGKLQECQCPICRKRFQYAVQLNKHLRESVNLLRACHICAEVMTRNKLIKHVQEVHDLKLHPCKKCPALLKTEKLHTDHNIKVHAKGNIQCIDCSYTFITPQAMYAHQHIHSKRSCPNCDKIFQNQPCYTYHIKKCCKLDSKHKNKQVPVTLQKKQNRKVKMGKRGSFNTKCICDHCNKTFSAKKFLAAHIQIVHLKNTHTPCMYCGKLFAAARMSTHLKSHAKPSFKCDHCGVVLKSKLGFTQHVRLHTGEKPYKCNLCDEQFTSSSGMSEHKRNKHFQAQIVLKYACTQCPAKFRLPSKLKMHTEKVHDEGSDSVKYNCELCGEMFENCPSLLKHLKIHSSP